MEGQINSVANKSTVLVVKGVKFKPLTHRSGKNSQWRCCSGLLPTVMFAWLNTFTSIWILGAWRSGWLKLRWFPWQPKSHFSRFSFEWFSIARGMESISIFPHAFCLSNWNDVSTVCCAEIVAENVHQRLPSQNRVHGVSLPGFFISSFLRCRCYRQNPNQADYKPKTKVRYAQTIL